MSQENKTVFFDLGNVLLFFSHEKMYKQIADFCDLKENEVRQILFTDSLGERYERGALESRALLKIFCERAKKDLDFAGFMRATSDIFEPNLAIAPIVKKLKENNIRLIILSNTCEAHFAYAFCHFPIIHLFDQYILSYELGSRKPESLIYAHALTVAGTPAQNCFYTDDIPEYVLAAKKEGLDGEIYTSAEALAEQLCKRGFL